MNILGCLDPLQSGNYYFNDRDISDYDEGELADIRNRYIGFIFQSYNLLEKENLVRNVALPLVYSNISERERLNKAAEILTTLGLGDKLSNLPGDISGGQRQRVAIARALANNPKIILADEPTGNLDSVTQSEIIKLFGEIRDKFRTTIVIVTHDEDVALYANRIITLFDGKIYADVSISDLEKNLKNKLAENKYVKKGIA